MKSDSEYWEQLAEVADLIAAQANREPTSADKLAACAILDAGYRKDEQLIQEWRQQLDMLTADQSAPQDYSTPGFVSPVPGADWIIEGRRYRLAAKS